MSVPVHNLLRTVQLEGSWKFEIFCQTLGGIEIVILLILHVFRNIYVSCVVNYVQYIGTTYDSDYLLCLVNSICVWAMWLLGGEYSDGIQWN